MQVTNGEQQHARSRAHTLGAPKDKAICDSAQQVEKTADLDFVGAAATVVLPAFLAALIAARFSGTRHSNGTTNSAMVVTSMAAVPVAIGAASGLGWCLRQQCFSSGPARDLWSKAGDVLQPRKEETNLKPSFVVLCQMGIEDIVEEEIVACLEKVGLDGHTSRSRILKQRIRGLVMVASGGDETEGVLLGLRTANYVIAYHCW